jgi:hypothetical protein
MNFFSSWSNLTSAFIVDYIIKQSLLNQHNRKLEINKLQLLKKSYISKEWYKWSREKISYFIFIRFGEIEYLFSLQSEQIPSKPSSWLNDSSSSCYHRNKYPNASTEKIIDQTQYEVDKWYVDSIVFLLKKSNFPFPITEDIPIKWVNSC